MGLGSWLKGMFGKGTEDLPQEEKRPAADFPESGKTASPKIENDNVSPKMEPHDAQLELFDPPAPTSSSGRVASPRRIQRQEQGDSGRRRFGAVERETVKVVVGMDFGTSSTKVVYRVLGAAQKAVYPLAVNPEDRFLPFALPSTVAFDRNGILFGQAAEKCLADKPRTEGVRYLKILLAGTIHQAFYDRDIFEPYQRYVRSFRFVGDEPEPGKLTAAFLAHAMQKAIQTLQASFPGRTVDANFNVCIPIDTFEMKEVKAGFQRVLNVAEKAVLPGDRNLSDGDIWRDVNAFWEGVGSEERSSSRVHLVPEAVAQMASYVDSLSAEECIHAVIDFGAGTTDFSIFNLCRDDEGKRCTYWYNARNFPGGLEKVETSLGNLMEEYRGTVVTHPDVIKAMRSLRIWRGPAAPRDKQLATNLRRACDAELRTIWEETRADAWGHAYGKNRDQNEWTGSHVRVFICGGGSALPSVKEIFCKSWMPGWGPYEIKELAAPREFRGPEKVFPRLAVAYGLTFPKPEMNRFVLPRDCPDQTKPCKWEDSFERWNVGAVYPDSH